MGKPTGKQLLAIGGGILAIATLVVTAGAWLLPDFDPFGVKRGRISSPDDVCIPFGNGQPTAVRFENIGQGEVVIERVEFEIKQKKPTRSRENIYGAAPPIEVYFRSNHWNGQSKFQMVFKGLKPVPPKEWGVFEVAIIEPNWIGSTYVGTLTAFYNGGRSHPFKNVEVDVISAAPAKTD